MRLELDCNLTISHLITYDIVVTSNSSYDMIHSAALYDMDDMDSSWLL